MLAFPYMYQGLKVILVFLLLCGIGVQYLKKKRLLSHFSYSISLWFSVFLFMNVFYLGYGCLRENPGVYYYIPVYAIWLILFFVLYSQIDESILSCLLKVFDVTYVFIAVTGVFFFFQNNGIFPTIINSELFGYKMGDRPMFEFKAIQGGAIISFLVLFSYKYTKLLLSKKVSFIQFVLLLIGIVYIFATSRRTFIIEFLFLPVIVFVFFRKSRLYPLQKKKVSLKIFIFFLLPFLLLLITTLYLGLFNQEIFTNFVLSSFESDGVGHDERSSQYSALITGWLNNFLFGAGTGVNASVIRSDIPGSYELSYVALLFERGIIGFLIYVIQFFYLLKWNIDLTRKELPDKDVSILISYNVALTFFLIANASNPYLGAFDHLWIVFFSLLLINSFSKQSLSNGTTNCLYYNKGL